MAGFTEKQKLEILERASLRALETMKNNGSHKRFMDKLGATLDSALVNAMNQRVKATPAIPKGWKFV